MALYRLIVEETKLSDSASLTTEKVRDFFESKRVLVLHAGGESRRLPAYVPEGKLFGPLSIKSDSDAKFPPVVLDMLLSLYAKYPWVPGEIMLASGRLSSTSNSFTNCVLKFSVCLDCYFRRCDCELRRGNFQAS